MATNFPSSLDSLTNPSAGDPTTNPSHAAQHANANDAIEALEAKVGINGSAVTTSLDYQRGLVFITSVSVGSGVTTVRVDNAFSSTYENYKIIYTNGVGSTSMALNLQLGIGSTLTNTNYFGTAAYVNLGAAAWQLASDNPGAQASNVGGGATSDAYIHTDIHAPNLAKNTYIHGPYMLKDFGRFGIHSYGQLSTTQFTSFQIGTSTGTITGGTIRVYGYKN